MILKNGISSSNIPATGSCGKKNRNRWNMEALFRPEIVQFFSGGFLPASYVFPAGTGRKSSEKFLPRILLTQNHRTRPVPGRTVRSGYLEKSPWVYFETFKIFFYRYSKFNNFL
jgi:hypothetical protein